MPRYLNSPGPCFDTEVLFEDKHIIPGAFTPMTWRVRIEARNIQEWDIAGIDLPVTYDCKAWLNVQRGSDLWTILLRASTDAEGFERIEQKIADELLDVGFGTRQERAA